MTTILGVLVVLALMAEGRLNPGSTTEFIDCLYENPELHMYMDRIDASFP